MQPPKNPICTSPEIPVLFFFNQETAFIRSCIEETFRAPRGPQSSIVPIWQE
jgi:hypothetical protein